MKYAYINAKLLFTCSNKNKQHKGITISCCRYLHPKLINKTLRGFINPFVLICIPFFRIPSFSSTRNLFKQPNNSGKCQLDRINWGTCKNEFRFHCPVFRSDIIWFRRPSWQNQRANIDGAFIEFNIKFTLYLNSTLNKYMVFVNERIKQVRSEHRTISFMPV